MLKWITLAPLIGAIINGLLGKRLGERAVAIIACGSVGVSTVLAFTAFFTKLLPLPPDARRYTEHFFTWLSVGSFHADFAYLLDPLSGIYILFITGVGLLIHIYATGYMHGDPGFYRFFAYLNLFMFMMLTLVLADNLLLLFVGWEGVGLCSYLLIGYYIRKQEAGDAAKKAFIVNRIGDFGYMIAVFLTFTTFGTISFVAKDGVESIMTQAAAMPVEAFGAVGVLTGIALLFFVGATGKSAQIPLFVWLPDAMAGPTPVSALIHAATMVTAGVYLVVRCSAIFVKAPTALAVVAVIGAVTAILAATIGIAQNDIKKVLAYSTVSQLGYMFLACGVGAFTAAIFHVMTHAFFKALLFLGSGSVIHGMHEEQDIRKMGGLKKYMPITWATMAAGWLAICGIPLFSGFFSKDEILWRTFATESLPHGWGSVLWVVGALTALLTAFYMTRLMVMTFWGSERFGRSDAHHGHGDGHGGSHGKPHESPAVMWIPLAVLAVLSVVGGYVGVPPALSSLVGIHSENHFEHFLEPAIGTPDVVVHAAAGEVTATGQAAADSHASHDVGMERLFTGISIVIAFLGIGLGWVIFNRQPLKVMPRLLENKYYVDEFYGAAIVRPLVDVSRSFLWKIVDVKIIDGIVNGSAAAIAGLSGVLRHSQTGYARGYAAAILLGAIVVVGFFALR
ncbi:MAG: NADH-quinone oxidoreductase subunit L [Acidobacteria bacterium]|nr:NADH-quinone oxidoreductase subunit L [Acidobacteriota bacterium]MCW5967124.1 NADH-quinone oxidoreductase subunit L [Blastocatellales bacterium]